MELSNVNRSNTDLSINNEVKCEFTKDKKNNEEVYEKKSNREDLDRAIDKLNRFLEDEKTHAEYSVHDTFSKRIIIKIVDDETDKVIMEVPQEKLLDAVASMCKAAGVLVDKRV